MIIKYSLPVIVGIIVIVFLTYYFVRWIHDTNRQLRNQDDMIKLLSYLVKQKGGNPEELLKRLTYDEQAELERKEFEEKKKN